VGLAAERLPDGLGHFQLLGPELVVIAHGCGDEPCLSEDVDDLHGQVQYHGEGEKANGFLNRPPQVRRRCLRNLSFWVARCLLC